MPFFASFWRINPASFLPPKLGKGFRQPSGTPLRDAPCQNGHYGASLRAESAVATQLCRRSGKTAEKLADSTVRFGLARAALSCSCPRRCTRCQFQARSSCSLSTTSPPAVYRGRSRARDGKTKPGSHGPCYRGCLDCRGDRAVAKTAEGKLDLCLSDCKIARPKSVAPGLRKNLPWQELVEHSPAR